MNKLEYAELENVTPVKVINGLRGGMKIYKGNILTYSVINENEGGEVYSDVGGYVKKSIEG